MPQSVRPNATRPVTKIAAVCGAALTACLLPGGVLATPATESDLLERKDGLLNLNTTIAYQSAHVFRGVKQAEDVVTLQLKTSLDTGLFNVDIGAKGFAPLQQQNAGIDEPNEVNAFAAARFNLADLIIAEAGATYYYYPGAEDVGDADANSLEIYGGLDLPIIIPVLIRAYYDVNYQNLTLETKGRWRQPILGDRLKLELNSVLGYVNAGDEGANITAAAAGARTLVGDSPNSFPPIGADNHRFYYGIGGALSSQITESVTVGANLNWAGTTGEFGYDGVTDDETLWGGFAVNIGL